VLVLLERDVPADHVVEEDAQGPHGEGVGRVTSETDPLRRGIHARPVKVGVVRLLEEGARAEVDELESSSGEINEDVLVLDVAVDDAVAVTGDH